MQGVQQRCPVQGGERKSHLQLQQNVILNCGGGLRFDQNPLTLSEEGQRIFLEMPQQPDKDLAMSGSELACFLHETGIAQKFDVVISQQSSQAGIPLRKQTAINRRRTIQWSTMTHFTT